MIDISKDRYDEIMAMDWKNCRLIFDEELRAIHDGNPLEECNDCISRQAAIDACLDGWNKGYKEIVEDIRALPPVTPKQTFESMTNGEVIQALFPKIKVKPLVGVKDLLHVFFDKKEDNAFDEDWWNAPYKGGTQHDD